MEAINTTPAVVFAIESGEYSDYRVHAVFTDRAKAEAWEAGYNAEKKERYNGR